MKYVLLLLVLFYIRPSAFAQTLGWSNIFSETTNTGSGPLINDMKADNEGNLIVGGAYSPTSLLNRKPLPKSRFFVSNGYVTFLAKFDTAGRLLWLDTTSASQIYHIEISEKGDYFFSGSCQPGATPFGAPNPTKLNRGGFIGKCDRHGKMQWIRKYMAYTTNSAGAYQIIYDFKVDKDENVYFVSDLPPAPGYLSVDTSKYYFQNAADLVRSCVAKFDSSGRFVWLVKKLQGGNTGFKQIDIDRMGHVYCVAGLFLDKLEKNGNLERKFSIDSANGLARITSFCADDNNHVFLFAEISDTLNYLNQTNTGNNFESIAKLDSDLHPVWVIYGQNYGIPEYPFFNKNTNSLYVEGGYTNTVNMEGRLTKNDASDTYPSYNNVFFVKIDSGGRITWLLNTTFSFISGIHNPPIIEDNCGNFFIALNVQEQAHFLGLNVAFSQKAYNGAVIAKFSSDSVGFVNQNASCGLSLKNISNPVFKKFTWFARTMSDTGLGKLISTGWDLNYLFPHRQRYIITLVANKAGGCTNIAWDTFNVAPSPVAGYEALDTQGCQYVKFYFKDTSYADTINAAVGESWIWDFGDGTPPQNYSRKILPFISHIYTQSGTYSVKLIYSNGFCSDTFISQKKVTIIPASKPGFTVSDTIGCAPLTVQVTNQGQAQVIKWIYTTAGDSFLSPSFLHTFTKPGKYLIHQYLTGITGCVTEDSETINVTPVFDDTYKTDIGAASINNNGNAEITWPLFPGAAGYNLYRYTDQDSSGSLVSFSANGISYTDTNVDPPNHTYSYYLKGLDGCGNLSGNGRIGRTIKLSLTMDNSLIPAIAWTPYIDWKNGVKTYQIYREVPGKGFEKIDSTSEKSFMDMGFPASLSYGDCYKVVAVSNDSDYKSASNFYCFSQKPLIFIPDIFTPDGDTLNDAFHPVVMGIKEYSMVIFNRWGEKVYYDFAKIDNGNVKGWDGNFKGQPSPYGVYIYFIKAKDYNNQSITRKGTLILER